MVPAVGHHRRPAGDPDHLGVHLVGHAIAADQFTRPEQLLVEGIGLARMISAKVSAPTELKASSLP